MKFNDVKVGDEVFIRTYVSYGWRKHRSFYIPLKVTKVTKSQLTTEDGRRFRKDNGKEIGENNSFAYKEGESFPYEEGIVVDETNKKEEFKKELKAEMLIQSKIDSLKVQRNSGLGLQKLTKINNLIKEIEKIIGND